MVKENLWDFYNCDNGNRDMTILGYISCLHNKIEFCHFVITKRMWHRSVIFLLVVCFCESTSLSCNLVSFTYKTNFVSLHGEMYSLHNIVESLVKKTQITTFNRGYMWIFVAILRFCNKKPRLCFRSYTIVAIFGS